MGLNLKYHGQLKDITGVNTEEIAFADSVQGLLDQLYLRYPPLRETQFSIAVNAHMTNRSASLKEGDTVALLPPFSGG